MSITRCDVAKMRVLPPSCLLRPFAYGPCRRVSMQTPMSTRASAVAVRQHVNSPARVLDGSVDTHASTFKVNPGKEPCHRPNSPMHRHHLGKCRQNGRIGQGPKHRPKTHSPRYDAGHAWHPHPRPHACPVYGRGHAGCEETTLGSREIDATESHQSAPRPRVRLRMSMTHSSVGVPRDTTKRSCLV